jgi:hypothetical protein
MLNFIIFYGEGVSTGYQCGDWIFGIPKVDRIGKANFTNT